LDRSHEVVLVVAWQNPSRFSQRPLPQVEHIRSGQQEIEVEELLQVVGRSRLAAVGWKSLVLRTVGTVGIDTWLNVPSQGPAVDRNQEDCSAIRDFDKRSNLRQCFERVVPRQTVKIVNYHQDLPGRTRSAQGDRIPEGLRHLHRFRCRSHTLRGRDDMQE